MINKYEMFIHNEAKYCAVVKFEDYERRVDEVKQEGRQEMKEEIIKMMANDIVWYETLLKASGDDRENHGYQFAIDYIRNVLDVKIKELP